MSVDHPDLIHEFPELRERIHELKTQDAEFRTLLDEYHELTRSIVNMESEVTPVSTKVEEDAKLRQVLLKVLLYAILMKQ